MTLTEGQYVLSDNTSMWYLPIRNFIYLFIYWRVPQQMLRTHRSLEGLLCNPVMKMEFFWFSIWMEHRWNKIDKEKPKYLEKTLSQFHFVHRKSHMDRPGIESGPPRWEAGD
jgi:hypothetical protein